MDRKYVTYSFMRQMLFELLCEPGMLGTGELIQWMERDQTLCPRDIGCHGEQEMLRNRQISAQLCREKRYARIE